MRITAIKQQLKRAERYSVFVDERYAFSLSDWALLEQKLAVGQELDTKDLKQLKQISAEDKLYGLTLRFATLRPRSQWEIEQYLKRKQANPELAKSLLSKLSNLALIDDERFAKAHVNDRLLLRPTSRRKLTLELRQKRISGQIIQKVMSEVEPETEQTNLLAVVEKKRRLPKYQDDLKLMQYLSRQGFNYDDIKAAIKGQK